MKTIISFVLLGIPVAGIIWIVDVVRSSIKKRFKRVLCLLLLPFLLYGFAYFSFGVYVKYEHRNYIDGLFSVHAELGETLFKYNSEPTFNGDGYSINVYSLPDSIYNCFNNPDLKLSNEYPTLPSYRKKWERTPWTKTPLSNDYERYLEFALSSYNQRNNEQLQKCFSDIRLSLSTLGNYYAFFYKDHGIRPGNIDFFLIDLINKKLYLINHNT